MALGESLDRLTAYTLEWLRKETEPLLGGPYHLGVDPARDERTLMTVQQLLQAAREVGVQPVPPEYERAAAAYDWALRELQHPMFVVDPAPALSYTRIWRNNIVDWYRLRPNPRVVEVQAEATTAQGRKADAEKRARQLIEDVVQPSEYLQFSRHQYIEIQGQWWRYRIRAVGQTQIRAHACGCLRGMACLQLGGQGTEWCTYPMEDRIVAEYLLLKNEEQRYLATANISWLDEADMDRLQAQPSVFEEPSDRLRGLSDPSSLV